MHKRAIWLVQSLLMAFLMSLFMSVAMTYVALGFGPEFWSAWMISFGVGFILSLPLSMVVGPLAEAIARKIWPG